MYGGCFVDGVHQSAARLRTRGSYPMCPSRQPEAVGRNVRFLWMVSTVQMMLPMTASVGTAAGALTAACAMQCVISGPAVGAGHR